MYNCNMFNTLLCKIVDEFFALINYLFDKWLSTFAYVSICNHNCSIKGTQSQFERYYLARYVYIQTWISSGQNSKNGQYDTKIISLKQWLCAFNHMAFVQNIVVWFSYIRGRHLHWLFGLICFVWSIRLQQASEEDENLS
jgi:hypothetical protein